MKTALRINSQVEKETPISSPGAGVHQNSHLNQVKLGAYFISSTPVFSSVNQVIDIDTMKISRKKEGQKEEKANNILHIHVVLLNKAIPTVTSN